VDVREIAVLALLASLFVVTYHVITARIARERELASRLDAAREEIAVLRSRLADATRPPTQFARTRMRTAAVDRIARLRLAMPPRSRAVRGDRVADPTR
jgi:hypothetical protein